MWAQDVFGSSIDGTLMIAALCLCLAVAWRVGRHLGPPRFPGAVGVLWVVGVAALPIPAYFAGGVGLWTGAILFEELGLGAPFGAALGWVLVPPLLCFLALSLLAALLTERRKLDLR